jgi:hypothetical protein
MLDQRATLDALRERAAVWLALVSLLRLEAMQLAMVPIQGRDADESPIVWGLAPSYGAMGKDPGIDAMRFPYFCQLLARFLQPQLLTQLLRFVALFDMDCSQLPQFLVEPRRTPPLSRTG